MFQPISINEPITLMMRTHNKLNPSDCTLTCPWALTLIQHPLITAESGVEPHGVVQRGQELGSVVGIRQQHSAQECKV